MALSTKQTPLQAAQHSKNAVGQFEKTGSSELSKTILAKDISRLVAAALCNALAGRTLYAMSDCEPWWLAHAASLTIRAFGMDLTNRSELLGKHRGLLHLAVMALGWTMDKVLSILHAAY